MIVDAMPSNCEDTLTGTAGMGEDIIKRQYLVKIDKSILGVAGEFAVAAELCRLHAPLRVLGLVAMSTTQAKPNSAIETDAQRDARGSLPRRSAVKVTLEQRRNDARVESWRLGACQERRP